MTIFAYLFIIGLLGLGSTTQWLSPASSYELTGAGDVDLSCRDSTAEELRTFGDSNYGKASTFNLRGSYRCERPIFEYGDRNSFINLVMASSPRHADYAARRVKIYLEDHLRMKSSDHANQVAVDVVTDLAVIKPYLENLYQTSLATRLARAQVLRIGKEKEGYLATLRIEVERVDDPEAILKASLGLQGARGVTWINL